MHTNYEEDEEQGEDEEVPYTTYLVLHKRDRQGEKMNKYDAMTPPRIIYDYAKECRTREYALTYASNHLPASIIVQGPANFSSQEDLRKTETPYAIAAKYEGKYRAHWMDGSSDDIVHYELVRANKENFESLLEEMSSEEHVTSIHAGLELSIIDSLRKK